MELVLFYGIPCVSDNAKYVANRFVADSGKCDITTNSLSMSAINCQALFLNGAETRRSTPFECIKGGMRRWRKREGERKNVDSNGNLSKPQFKAR